MNSLSRFLGPPRGLYLFAVLISSFSFPSGVNAQAPPAVPTSFQNLYTELDSDLTSFDTALNSKWNGTKYPVIFTANLWNASANTGPQMLGSDYYVNSVAPQLQQLKAMGVQAVGVEVGFPMLYGPFLGETQYQEAVSFYQQVAKGVRAAGLKLIVDNECLRNGVTFSGWDTGPFYATLDWTQYQAARAQTAVTIWQTLQPDYMVVLEEPDTEATMSGQTEVGTPSGATSMLSQILTAMQQAGVSGPVGAGVGTWLAEYQQFIQNFVTLPVNFIDMHILPVDGDCLPNAMSIATIAAGAGLHVTMSQTWLRKVSYPDSTETSDQIEARNPFSFWAPLDTYFLQIMQKMAYYTQMTFMDVFQSMYFWAYLPYDNSTEDLAPADILNQESTQSTTNMLAAEFTSTAVSYYSEILPAPDTTPPSTPSNLAGSSGQPTQAYLTWDASTDNVGVAGYLVLRNGTKVGTTAQAFYTDTGLTDATTYSYAVKAFDLAGNLSAPSLTINVTTFNNIPPTVPGSVVAAAANCQTINLTWSASTDKIAINAYYVFQGTSANNLVQVATTYGTTFSYTAYPLTPSTAYYFAVEAEDTDANVSPMSTIVSATTLALPTPPTKLVATPISTSAIGLTWSAGPSGMPLNGYYVFRGTSPANLTQVGGGAANSYTDTSLTPATTYYYAVEEIDEDGNVSPMSAVVSAATLTLPTAPLNLVATPVSTTQIGLTWAPGPSAMPLNGYYILRGTSPSNLTQVAGTGTTAYTDYSLTPSTTYYYAVEEINQAGNVSPMSIVVSATTMALPTAPTSLVATPVTTTQIGLTWSPVSSGMPVTGYYIFRGTSASNLVQVGTSPTTAFTNYQLTPGTTYYYAVQETNGAGNLSPMSVVVSVATPALPTAPTKLVATPITTAAIGLTWSAGPSGLPLTGYYVFRGTSPSNLTQVGGTAVPSYTDTSLAPSTTYYYAVEEFDVDGNISPMSAVVSATTLALPTPPVSLVATPVSTAQIGLTWSPGPSGMPLSGYYILRGTSPSSLTQVAATGTTAYTDYSLTPSTTYYYAVKEVDQAGNVSPMSTVVSATTMAPPAAPINVAATPVSAEEISLTWSPGPSGMPVASYYIFCGTSPSNMTQVATETTPGFNDYSVTPATTYYCAVEETNSAGNISPMSAVVMARTPSSP